MILQTYAFFSSQTPYFNPVSASGGKSDKSAGKRAERFFALGPSTILPLPTICKIGLPLLSDYEQ
jgi:hypothetical protein